jgi:hypothetical protein
MKSEEEPDYLTVALLSGLCGYVATMLPCATPIQFLCGIGAAYLTRSAYLKQHGWW